MLPGETQTLSDDTLARAKGIGIEPFQDFQIMSTPSLGISMSAHWQGKLDTGKLFELFKDVYEELAKDNRVKSFILEIHK